MGINEERALIRRAWNSGKTEVEVNGVLFKLKLSVHHVTVHVGGQNKKVKEQWILATPADGRFVPMYSVGLNNKLRTSMK